MAIEYKSITNYTIDGVIYTDLNKTLRNTHHYKVKDTYSILNLKIKSYKSTRRKNNYKYTTIITKNNSLLKSNSMAKYKDKSTRIYLIRQPAAPFFSESLS